MDEKIEFVAKTQFFSMKKVLNIRSNFLDMGQTLE